MYQVLERLFGESDGAKAKRLFNEEVAAHAKQLRSFRVEAELAGFSGRQIDVMAAFLALSDHSHQYYFSPHWSISSPPVDGHFEDREE